MYRSTVRPLLFVLLPLAIAVLAFVVVAAAALGWLATGGAGALVDAALPEFPDWPPPLERLTDERAGEIRFATSTPFDLDVLLRAPELATPTTGIGTTIRPFLLRATARSPRRRRGCISPSACSRPLRPAASGAFP